MQQAKIILVTPIQVYVRCPFCDRIHKHGTACMGIDEDNYGSRVPHCTKIPNEQYELVAAPFTQRESKPNTRLENRLLKEIRGRS